MNEVKINFQSQEEYSLFKAMLGNGMAEIIKKDSEIFGGYKRVFNFYTELAEQLPLTIYDNQDDDEDLQDVW